MQGETFVFFGIVGSGKGTQVKLLKEYLEKKSGRECVYIGTGEIFRKILQSSENNTDTEIVKEILSSGRLMPDSETNKLVANAIRAQWVPGKHLLFDGYPRTVPQSKFFEEMTNSYKIENVKIIYIELSKDEAMKRNLLRGRHDDTKEGLTKRFEEYEKNVVPAMNYFKEKSGYTIYQINGEQSIENVKKDIINALNL
ncbi:MAG: nucleoside monophosphate kinase [Patescibacteria group bacterium]